MSNFKDAISANDLQALMDTATERKEMRDQAPWKGTEESIGDADLGIVQQAIDAVDDNCDFPIVEFLKGAHYSLYLYMKNIEGQLKLAVSDGEDDVVVMLAARLGEVKTIYMSLANTFEVDLDGDSDAEEETKA
tara:strand:- start:1272 stop:1673 length:402 start_codon:yes stop_codon:yes gene_type:complete